MCKGVAMWPRRWQAHARESRRAMLVKLFCTRKCQQEWYAEAFRASTVRSRHAPHSSHRPLDSQNLPNRSCNRQHDNNPDEQHSCAKCTLPCSEHVVPRHIAEENSLDDDQNVAGHECGVCRRSKSRSAGETEDRDHQYLSAEL